MEVWRVCKLRDDFEVSNLGRVRNIRTKNVKKPRKGAGGYMRINYREWHSLRKKYFCTTYYVHRLVASTFLPNEDGYTEVNHIDLNKENNCVDNLEWCTRIQNVRHARLNGAYSRASA